ncbi:MAG: ribose-phosphate diphosphokinase [Anaerolineae bacterium]
MAEDTEALTLVGDVKGHDVIIVDDEVDTGGSITSAARVAQEHGARDIYLCFAHAVFSPPAVERLQACPVKEIVTTNSIPIPPEKRMANLAVLSVAGLLGEVIRRVHEGCSVGEMFRGYQRFK